MLKLINLVHQFNFGASLCYVTLFWPVNSPKRTDWFPTQFFVNLNKYFVDLIVYSVVCLIVYLNDSIKIIYSAINDSQIVFIIHFWFALNLAEGHTKSHCVWAQSDCIYLIDSKPNHFSGVVNHFCGYFACQKPHYQKLFQFLFSFAGDVN